MKRSIIIHNASSLSIIFCCWMATARSLGSAFTEQEVAFGSASVPSRPRASLARGTGACPMPSPPLQVPEGWPYALVRAGGRRCSGGGALHDGLVCCCRCEASASARRSKRNALGTGALTPAAINTLVGMNVILVVLAN